MGTRISSEKSTEDVELLSSQGIAIDSEEEEDAVLQTPVAEMVNGGADGHSMGDVQDQIGEVMDAQKSARRRRIARHILWTVVRWVVNVYEEAKASIWESFWITIRTIVFALPWVIQN